MADGSLGRTLPKPTIPAHEYKRWPWLKHILTEPKPAYCQPSRWDNIKMWWQDTGPRMPAWNIDVYHEYTPEEDADNEFLFTLYQLNWFEARSALKLLRATDRPLLALKTYSW